MSNKLTWIDLCYGGEVGFAEKRQNQRERYAKDNYGVEIKRTEIPAGEYCNKDVEHWCQYCVADRCLKYGGCMWTGHGIGYGYHAQHRRDECKREFPKGFDGQMTIEKYLEG